MAKSTCALLREPIWTDDEFVTFVKFALPVVWRRGEFRPARNAQFSLWETPASTLLATGIRRAAVEGVSPLLRAALYCAQNDSAFESNPKDTRGTLLSNEADKAL